MSGEALVLRSECDVRRRQSGRDERVATCIAAIEKSCRWRIGGGKRVEGYCLKLMLDFGSRRERERNGDNSGRIVKAGGGSSKREEGVVLCWVMEEGLNEEENLDS